MNIYKIIKNQISTRFFDFPEKKLKSKFLSLKYHLATIKFDSNVAEIFICNKTSPYDKFFVSNCIETYFVFLKDSFIENLYRNSVSDDDMSEFLREVEILKKFFISIVIFPERHISVTGDFGKIPKFITDFVYDLNYDCLSFINLIGTYYIRPIWACKDRICDTKIEQKFTTTFDELTKDDFYKKFNKSMPSSASVYSNKVPIYLRGNKLAENFETFLYFCPTCKNLFTIYSEFSCLKCKECGTAFEFSSSGKIDLCKQFSTLDGAREFQLETLNSVVPTFEKLMSYDRLQMKYSLYHEKFVESNETKLDIYQNKIVLENFISKTEINFNRILDIFLYYDNNLYIMWKDDGDQKKEVIVQANNKENLYIIIDLIDYYKNHVDFFEKGSVSILDEKYQTGEDVVSEEIDSNVTQMLKQFDEPISEQIVIDSTTETETSINNLDKTSHDKNSQSEDND